jgi:hypothetical protein
MSDGSKPQAWLAAASSRDEERHVLLRYLPAAATAEQRQAARESALHRDGDMRLVWVPESDLATLTIQGRAVNWGPRDD